MKTKNGYWIVTVHYDPGTPRTYQVVGAKDQTQAEETVLHYIGYNPGVPVRSQAADGQPDPSGYPILHYSPLSNSEREALRFND